MIKTLVTIRKAFSKILLKACEDKEMSIKETFLPIYSLLVATLAPVPSRVEHKNKNLNGAWKEIYGLHPYYWIPTFDSQ